MAVKSIIEIDLIGEVAFQKFASQYRQYDELLKTAPGSWDQAKKSMGGSVEAWRKLVDSSKKHLLQTRMIADAEKQAIAEIDGPAKRREESAARQARAWEMMSKNAKGFAGSIATATTSLLRWTSLTGVISGVLGVGGLMGIDRLALSVGNQRRSGLGLGVNPGEQNSFGLNLGRVLGSPNSLLGGVNDALSDIRKSVPFGALGLNYREEQGKGTFGASIDVVKSLKKLLDKTPLGMVGPTMDAFHIGDLGISKEDALALKRMSKDELEAYIKQAQEDAKHLDLTKKQQKAWQDLQTQLARSSLEIERAFIIGLKPLTSMIGQFSKALAGAISAFGESKEVQRLFEEAASGLGKFSKELDSPEFSKRVDGFISGVGEMGDAAMSFADWVKKLIGKDDKDSTGPGDTLSQKKQLGEAAIAGAGAGGVLGWLFGGKWGGRAGAVLGGGLGYGTEWGAQWADHYDARHPWAGNLDRYLFGGSDDKQGASGQGLTKSLDSLTETLRAILTWGTGASKSAYETSAGGRPHLFRDAVYRQPFPGSMGAPLPGAGAIPKGMGASFNEKMAHDFFRSQGWTEAQTAGLLANAKAESGFRTDAFNPAGGGRGAQGLFQWRGSRVHDFEGFFGHSPRQGSELEQLLFAQWELTHKEKKAGDDLRRYGRSGGISADIINREFERSGVSSGQRNNLGEMYSHIYGRPGATIHLRNATGGNTTVTVSQLGVNT